MAEIENAFSTGTRGIETASDSKKNFAAIPINEDWTVLGKVVAHSGGYVKFVKVWDTGATKKLFCAQAYYAGTTDLVPDGTLQPDQIFPFHRCGQWNSRGSAAMELQTQSELGFSWVCYIANTMIYIRDLGNSTGEQVVPQGAGWAAVPSSILPLRPLDSTTRFYGGKWSVAGRVYTGKKIGTSFYLVNLHGFGNYEKSFVQGNALYVFTLKTDGVGKLLEFTVTSL